MGHPSSIGPVAFKVLATVSAIFAIGVIAVSAALLNQAVGYRDTIYYSGYGYGGGFGAYNPEYYGRGYYGGQSGYVGAGINPYYSDVGYDVYRFHKVITIAAIALGGGILQFFVSLILCCVNENNAKGMAIGYAAGGVFIFIIIAACFGLGFHYKVIYPVYFYNYYQSYQYNAGYYQYNSEGQAFCAILGLDLIFLLISAIIGGVLARKSSNYEDRVEWHVRPTASPATQREEYSRT